MNAVQRKSALPAATGEDAKNKRKIVRLHITTPDCICQILREISDCDPFRAAVALAAFIGMLGVIGGIEQETIRLWPGCLCLIALFVLLDWGSKPWQG